MMRCLSLSRPWRDCYRGLDTRRACIHQSLSRSYAISKTNDLRNSGPQCCFQRRMGHSHEPTRDVTKQKIPIHDWRKDHYGMLFQSIPKDLRIGSFQQEQSLLLDELLADVMSSSNPPTPEHPAEGDGLASPLSNHQTPSTQLTLGRHQVYCNIPIRPDELMSDGTDKRFLPGSAQFWPVRLWAGGAVTLHTRLPPKLSNDTYNMEESVSSVRVTGKDEPEKAFVTVTKHFSSIDSHNDASGIERKKLNQRDHETSASTHALKPRKFPILTEEYTLCFLRDKPKIGSRPSGIRPPSNPKFFHSMTPTKDLLFCWSALTYNAHRIHIDPHFAQQEYGVKNLLVHGPLTLMLMLDYLQRIIDTTNRRQSDATGQVLRSITYRNLAPLFVDEPITICASPAKPTIHGLEGMQEKWDVWIQTGAVDDTKSSLAVKAIVLVDNMPTTSVSP